MKSLLSGIAVVLCVIFGISYLSQDYSTAPTSGEIRFCGWLLFAIFVTSLLIGLCDKTSAE